MWHVPLGPLVGVLGVVTVLCKSLNALFLTTAGIGIYWFTRWVGLRWALAMLLLVPPLYAGLRISRAWSGDNLVQAVERMVDDKRAQSLQARLDYEALLIDKAHRRPILGWGGWDRNRVFDSRGRDITVTDGLWIIAFGKFGLVGLSAFLAALLLPVARFMRYYPPRAWRHPMVVPAAGLSVVVALYTVDCLPNSMVNPIMILTVGGLSGLLPLAAYAGRQSVAASPRADDLYKAQPVARGDVDG